MRLLTSISAVMARVRQLLAKSGLNARLGSLSAPQVSV